ncbi:hypothetical protein [Actinoplanes rectilineatus]|uniref:hypothetical protein n=1 Tax=Actinoplanes rectilineatus TaxID=113571 RepID=UPI0005F2BF0A|nr:hypothetical protein [Actinoplanes rectilineatus]
MDEGGAVGDGPPADGMRLSVRIRHDFTVGAADRLLAAARRTHRRLNPDASADDAATMVTSGRD